jgi:hypothetical protein
MWHRVIVLNDGGEAEHSNVFNIQVSAGVESPPSSNHDCEIAESTLEAINLFHGSSHYKRM